MNEICWMIDMFITYSSMSEASRYIGIRNNISAIDDVLSDEEKFFPLSTICSNISEAGRYIGVRHNIRAIDNILSHEGKYFVH